MILRNRVIWSDNGVLKDISDIMNNHISGTKVIPFVATQDYLYFGSDAPFNNRWIEVKVANDQASIMSVSIWDGSAWQAVSEVIDQTLNLAGDKSLSQSGRIAWVPDKQKSGWSRDDTQDGNNTITGLSTVKIYDLYWARIAFNGDLKVTTELSFAGWKFANDEDLYSLWPEFDTPEARTRFKDGTTTFDQIHFEAAKLVIRDLEGQKVIDSGNQLLEWEVLRLPSIHKAAELIFSAYGSDYKDEIAAARQKYLESMKVELFRVDLNDDAILTPVESKNRTGRLVR